MKENKNHFLSTIRKIKSQFGRIGCKILSVFL
nr:MAG TPA: hypothetical protein [Caudoviricetes sp.]